MDDDPGAIEARALQTRALDLIDEPPARGETRFKWGSVLRLVAGGISLVAIAWVVWPLARDFERVRSEVAAGDLVVPVVVGGVAYAALTVLLGVAWWWLSGIEGARPPVIATYGVWARSQIAKYLPGNVFHYATRQVIGRRLGLSHPTLISSGVLEMGSTVLAALAISLWGAVAGQSGMVTPTMLAMLLGAAALGLLVWPVVDRLMRRLPACKPAADRLAEISRQRLLFLVGPAFLLHVAFLLGTGFVMYGLLQSGWSGREVPVLPVVVMYALAWLLGTLVPGAPGGLGIREAVLTFELAPLIGPANASALALLLRFVTTAGDVLTALLGWATKRENGDITI